VSVCEEGVWVRVHLHIRRTARAARRLARPTAETSLSDKTHADYLWRLSKYLLPFFARMPVAGISDSDCRRFRTQLFAEREQLEQVIAAGAPSVTGVVDPVSRSPSARSRCSSGCWRKSSTTPSKTDYAATTLPGQSSCE
jgi:hypothetical protein